MVRLTRIYTRTGDDGSTALGDLTRTSKTDSRLGAYAAVDETNTSIGVALALGGLDREVEATLGRIQQELFDVGADLCTPVADASGRHREVRRVGADLTAALERDCDQFNSDLPKLNSFILPGGSPGAALLHSARTTARRAERTTWSAIDEHGETINVQTARYLNRLSDLLFILARRANHDSGHDDVLWQQQRS